MKSSIGIYPGAFDPVHLGHLAFAKEAMRACGLDEVVFLPEPRPRGKPDVTDISHRAALIRLAAEGTPGLGVLKLGQEQFTVDGTLPELERVFGGARLTFLMGSDVARGLPKWENVKTLLDGFNFAIGLRGNDSQKDVDEVMCELRATHHAPEHYACISTQSSDLASSAIRGYGADDAGLHPAVASYIAEHGLYAA